MVGGGGGEVGVVHEADVGAVVGAGGEVELMVYVWSVDAAGFVVLVDM